MAGGGRPEHPAGTGPEWLVPVIPAATTPWAGDWFGTRDARSPVTPVSIAVLPGGTVHTWGSVMSQAAGLADAGHPAWSAAAWQARERGRPTPVAVGHADGRVETFLVAADGAARPVNGAHLPPPARRPPDPCWGDPARVAHDLCVRPAAPGLGLALKAAARDAALDGDWDAATHLYTVAAARLHGQGAPAEAERVARLAVTAWLRAGPPDSTRLGFTLVHLLISTFPGLPGPIGALLRRLADHLPGTATGRLPAR